MTSWTRARLDTRCGACGDPIRVGALLCRITLPAVTRPKLRCVRCADGVAPELPPLDVETIGRMPAVPAMRRLGLLPLDEPREPGEDG